MTPPPDNPATVATRAIAALDRVIHPPQAASAAIRGLGRQLHLFVGFFEQGFGLCRVTAQIPFVGTLRLGDLLERIIDEPLGGREIRMALGADVLSWALRERGRSNEETSRENRYDSTGH